MLRLRERGRQAVRTLIDFARAEFAAAQTPERYTFIRRELTQKMNDLDDEMSILIKAASNSRRKPDRHSHSKVDRHFTKAERFYKIDIRQLEVVP